MAATLQATFIDAETYFNNADLFNLAKLLHQDVIMWHVDDRKPPIIGMNDVVEYFRALPSKGDWSRFEHLPQGQAPLAFPQPPGDSTIHQNGTSGVVQGTAYWKDKSSDPDTTRRLIRYVFVFEEVGGQWFIHHLKGNVI
jgi:hypothetical protein